MTLDQIVALLQEAIATARAEGLAEGQAQGMTEEQKAALVAQGAAEKSAVIKERLLAAVESLVA